MWAIVLLNLKPARQTTDNMSLSIFFDNSVKFHCRPFLYATKIQKNFRFVKGFLDFFTHAACLYLLPYALVRKKREYYRYYLPVVL